MDLSERQQRLEELEWRIRYVHEGLHRIGSEEHPDFAHFNWWEEELCDEADELRKE